LFELVREIRRRSVR